MLPEPSRPWLPDGRTGEEVLAYYERAGDAMLPFLRGRPLVLLLKRFGRRPRSSFHRQAPTDTPDWVRALGITSPATGKTVDYLLAQDLRSLLWVVRLGCVEIHAWHSRRGSIARPDYAFFDLDPAPGTAFELVRTIALRLRHELDAAGLRSYVKGSGGTGLHVFVPIERHYGFGQVRGWVEEMCRGLNQRYPEETTMRWEVARRRGVFLDASMMAPNKNVIVPLSLRDRPGAPISAPLGWDELAAGAHPSDFTIDTATAELRRRARSFTPVLEGGQELPVRAIREDGPREAPEWRRLPRKRIRCVIGGWAPGEGESPRHMGSLLLGLFYLGEVAFVGKVEVPFEHRHELHVRLAEQAAADPPFVTLPRQLRGAHWVKPGLACAVDCSGLTGGPDLRAPAYIGLLPEVDAAHCALAQLDEAFGQRRAG